MEIQEFIFSVDELGLQLADIEQFIGYPKGHAPAPVCEMIEEALHTSKTLGPVKGGYRLINAFSVYKGYETICVSDTEMQVKKIIGSQFRKAESVALFCCTAGPGISSLAEMRLKLGDLPEAYILDAVGSEIVETAMDLVQDQLEERVKQEGLHITNRYSPGYCGWHVSEQQQLFSLLPEKFCGVSLTDCSLMQPVKSVSGIIGIGRQVKRTDYSCHVCEMSNCIYRKKKDQA